MHTASFCWLPMSGLPWEGFALDFTEKYDVLAKGRRRRGRYSPGGRFSDPEDRERTDRHFGPDLIRLDDMRGKVLENLDALEEYLHYFQLYEHIFNRLNYRFEDSLPLTDDAALARRLMGVYYGKAGCRNGQRAYPGHPWRASGAADHNKVF